MSARKALVIGIDNYLARPLKNCINDAETVGIILDSENYGFDVKFLLDKDANRREVLTQLNNLFTDDATFVVVYFAGHGAATDVSTYLVPFDADDVEIGIEFDFLRRLIIRKSRPDLSILVLLDCCHSGAANIRATSESKVRPMTNAEIEQSFQSLVTSTVVMAACQPHEYAFEQPSIRHGVFTYYLIEGLYGEAADSNGDVTVPNLYDYISRKFSTLTGQTPVFKGDIIGRIVLGSKLKPRDVSIVPEQEVRQIEITAEKLMNEYIESTSTDLESWSNSGYRFACTSLLPKLRWFHRQVDKHPRIIENRKFRSAFSTAKSKLADLGHLKEDLCTDVGVISAKLGSGTFGTVWKVISNDNTFAAYKVYHPLDLDNKEKLARFDRGYRAMEQLDHPHVVKVLRQTECPIGFLMDYIDGVNLRQFAYIETEPVQILTQLLTVGETLKHAHSRDVIHRDVKPENIVMQTPATGSDAIYRPYLTDFDLAWFSTATQFTKEGLGSLIYAAPEQIAKPQSADAHAATTDVYAFGQLCFFHLCRRDPVPLLADNARALQEVVRLWGVEEPARRMVDLYNCCTHQNPKSRIQDFREICDHLFELIKLLSEVDHQRTIGFPAFVKEFVFSIVGLSPEKLVSETQFYTKTGQYLVSIESPHSWAASGDLIMKLEAQSSPAREGMTSHRELRKKLNKKVDAALSQYREVKRHSGSEGPYNISLHIGGVDFNTDGVEYCRQVLMRVINCLEGGQ